VKIFPDKLATNVGQSLMPLYILSGDETLLVNEAADIIRLAAKKQGFLERETFDADLPGFDWEVVLQTLNSLSLFAEKKLVEIRCSKKNLNAETFIRYWERHNPDMLVLVITEKLDKAAQSSKWFGSLEKIGAFVQVWPLEADAFQRWLTQRARQQGLLIEAQAIALLQERTEGNLLAAVQELEKLHLQFGDKPINASTLENAVANNARYDVFSLTESVLTGNSAESLKILQSLLEEGGAEFLILRTLTRELRILASVKEAMDAGQPASSALQKHGVWDKRQPAYQSSLKRLSTQQIGAILQQASQLDMAIMGLVKKNVADGLQDICLAICGTVLFPSKLKRNV
jgi:DNA polymerase-3 subunit delta